MEEGEGGNTGEGQNEGRRVRAEGSYEGRRAREVSSISLSLSLSLVISSCT